MRNHIIALLDRVINWGNTRLDRSGGGGVQNAETTHDATIAATITRADGSIENLGIISDAKITIAGNKKLNEDQL